MILGIEKEVAIILVAFLDGALIALIYSAIQVFRRIIIHNLFWISIEDLLFWIVSAIYVFMEIVRACSGNIRWYFVLGILLGGISTGVGFRKLIKKYVDKPRKTR